MMDFTVFIFHNVVQRCS